MFRNACAIARDFTWPIVISCRMMNGRCVASIGTCVVINDKGWIITAGHILTEIQRLADSEQKTRDLENQIKAVNAEASMARDERRRRLKKIGPPRPEDTDRSGVWFGRDGVIMKEGYRLPLADIGVARLEPYDPSWVLRHPVFKDPSKNFEPGTSLCRMGFPFHRITPMWDETKAGFQLPLGSVPLPLFPIEGIFTRTAEIILAPGPGSPAAIPPFPLRMVETSSVGIPGQSGGPIFDTEGRIWGIQSSTSSFPLELKTPEKQYLNVGLGVHPDTIFGFLEEQKIEYQKSIN